MTRMTEIAKEAQRLIGYCQEPLRVTPDIFGDIETAEDRNQTIEACVGRIVKMTSITDDDWDASCVRTAAEVAEADHPRFSCL